MMEELKTLNLGKNGISQGFITEAKGMLARYRKIKIKVLKSALEEKKTIELAGETALKTNSKLTQVRGHTFILAKR